MKVQSYLKSKIAAVKESLKKPHVQKDLKITAVAMATLALMAAALSVALIVSTPVFVLIPLIAGAGAGVSFLIGTKFPKVSMQKFPRVNVGPNDIPLRYETPVERINRDVFGMPHRPAWM